MSVSAHLHSSYRNLASTSLGELGFEAADNRAYAMQGTGGLEATRRMSGLACVAASYLIERHR